MPGSNYRPENIKRIFLLPNLMTAGNLIFGFLAVLKIFEGSIQRETGGENWGHTYVTSLQCILAACLFDLLDGRLARMGGRESPFGREFDSLADVVSFGVAPALLVFKIVLYELPSRIGWVIAVFYLLCGAFRLARFNVAATYNLGTGTKNFTGFPVPAAAGLIASITLVIIPQYERQADLPIAIAIGLATLMVFLSLLMVSNFEYPSFKGLNLRTQFSPAKFVAALFVFGMAIVYYEWMPAVIFGSYLLYGFTRPFLSRAMRKEIEEEEEDALVVEPVAPPPPEDS